MKQVVLLFVVSVFLSCSTSHIQGIRTRNPMPPVPAEVEEYVAKHKDWKRRDYRIEQEGREGPSLRYVVIYLPEEKTVRLGGGKTFAVYYNPSIRKVVEERHFQ